MSVSNAFVLATLEITYVVLDLYVWAVIIGAVLSWLKAFNVINPYNRFVQVMGDMLTRITEPLLTPIRRVLPNMGPMDFSPVVLIFILIFLKSFIRHLVV